MKILVCGGRNYGRPPLKKDGTINNDHPLYETQLKQRFHIYKILDELAEKYSEVPPPGNIPGCWLPNGITIISGGATGADEAAIDWAIVNWVKFKEYPANWDKFGKKAGVLRNVEMLEKESPDIVVAFPGGTGTAHMVMIAKKAGIEVIEVQPEV